jgi:hypothetical protein
MSTAAARKRSRDTDTEPEVAADNGNRRRATIEKAKDLDLVMAKCRELRRKLETKISTKDLAIEDLAEEIPSDILEVAELSSTEVVEGIENVALRIAHQVLARKGFSMDIPSRAASNQVYIKGWDRIVLGGKRSSRKFTNVKVLFHSRVYYGYGCHYSSVCLWSILLMESTTHNMCFLLCIC